MKDGNERNSDIKENLLSNEDKINSEKETHSNEGKENIYMTKIPFKF